MLFLIPVLVIKQKRKQQPTLMSAITMTTTIEQGVANMLSEHTTACTKALAEKYGFDLEEALRSLNLEKTKVKKEKAPKAEKSPKKEKKAASGEDKPKRPPTGYLLFSADARPAVKQELTDALEEGEKLKPQAVVSELAARWKALSDEEREEWNAQAKAAASDSE